MTYLMTGKVVQSGRVFTTSIQAESPARAFRKFLSNHPRSLFLGYREV